MIVRFVDIDGTVLKCSFHKMVSVIPSLSTNGRFDFRRFYINKS